MIIYPSIDVRGGNVVRLKEGDPNRQTVFSDNPVEVARRWMEQGARWTHVVNLDGTLSEAAMNWRMVEEIERTGAQVQFGGGLRAMDDIERAFEHKVARVVLGTIAVRQPEIVEQAIERWGADRICVALDARDGKVVTHGWQQTTELTPVEFGQQMRGRGVEHVLFTDVNRDGGLQGANIEATTALARETGLQVIASGGVSSVDEIRQMAESRVVAGAVIGTALYEGRITLADALRAAGGE